MVPVSRLFPADRVELLTIVGKRKKNRTIQEQICSHPLQKTNKFNPLQCTGIPPLALILRKHRKSSLRRKRSYQNPPKSLEWIPKREVTSSQFHPKFTRPRLKFSHFHVGRAGEVASIPMLKSYESKKSSVLLDNKFASSDTTYNGTCWSHRNDAVYIRKCTSIAYNDTSLLTTPSACKLGVSVLGNYITNITKITVKSCYVAIIKIQRANDKPVSRARLWCHRKVSREKRQQNNPTLTQVNSSTSIMLLPSFTVLRYRIYCSKTVRDIDIIHLTK